MRLYVNPISPFCRAAAVYLREGGVRFESVALTTGADRSRLLEIDRTGEVPVLETPNGTVRGSRAICDLAEVWSERLPLVLADSTAGIASSRLEDVACSITDALQFLNHLVHERRPELAREQAGFVGRLEDAIQNHYAFLDACLAEASFLAGPYSRADVFGFAMASSLVFLRRPIPQRLAALRDWFGRMASRPAIARDLRAAAASAALQAKSADPFFHPDRVHWRSHRIEWAVRLGLGSWLAEEVEQGRAYFSQPPEPPSPRTSST